MNDWALPIPVNEYINQAEAFLRELNINPELFQSVIKSAIEDYLQHGLCVIPVALSKDEKIAKKPLIKWKEFQERKPTIEEIESWFERYKYFNIAIVCGSISNFSALDIDEKNPKVREFATIETGKGYQIWARCVKKSENLHSKPDIRIKGEGGYVLAPPSIHYTGAIYRWTPGKDLNNLYDAATFDNIIKKIKALYNIKEEPVKESEGEKEFERPPLQFPCFVQAHKETPEGTRNETLFALGMMLFANGFQDPLFLLDYLKWFNKTYCKPPLDEKEIKNIVKSIIKHEYIPSCKAIMSRLKPDCKGCPLNRFKKVEAEKEEEVMVKDEELEEFLPEGYDLFRDYQPELIRAVKEQLEKGSCGLNAPTGAGKTIIFDVVARWLGVPTLIVEPNRPLQDQVHEKDPDVFVLKGRRNYYCPVTGKTADKAPCIIKKNFKCKEICPYYLALDIAKKTLENRGIVCVNFANWWILRNYRDDMLIIIDEAHLIVKQLASPIQVRSNRISDIQAEIEELEREIDMLRDKADELDEDSKEYDEIAKEINKKVNRLKQLRWLISNQEHLLFFRKKGKDGKYRWYAKVEEEAIVKWLTRKHWCLLVSATLPDMDVPVVKSDKFVATRKNAPIVYFPIEKLTKTSQLRKGFRILKFAANIVKLISNYYNADKVVVHVMDIEQTGKEIARYLQPYKVKLHEKGSIEKCIEEFKKDDSRFLVIAQAHTGFDWSFVQLQFVINLPYPGNPYDPEWKAYAEKYGWEKAREKYNKEMVQNLIQLCGRVCRGREDTGITFILDRKFGEIYLLYNDWFPEEFKNRLVLLVSP